ncbi:hypothetical protein ACS0TY_013975 [Phlomoides rotata]
MSSGDRVSQSSSKNSMKLAYSRFTQQELPACKPILTPRLVMETFVLLDITFILIGLSHLSASDNLASKLTGFHSPNFTLDQLLLCSISKPYNILLRETLSITMFVLSS